MSSSPLPTLPYFLSYLVPLAVVFCLYEGGWWTFAPLAIFFLALPILDFLFGVAGRWREAPDLAFNKYFRVVTWTWVPVHVVLLFWVLREIAGGRLSQLEIIGSTLSMGLVAGTIAASFAHEMIHRRHEWERTFGHVLLTLISYTHFAVGHFQWHHRWLATPHDPGTARLNQSFYGFLPRALIGGVRTAWAFEKVRLHRNNKLPLSFANRMFRIAVVQALMYAGLWYYLGTTVTLAFAGQAALAIIIIEGFNYIGHYGLLRREVAPGEYERVAPNHSWDSAYRITNWLLINMPRHSDHHCAHNKRYQALELLPQAPKLPSGYGTLLLMALLPPLWFSVMNRRVAEAAKLGHP